MVNCHGASLLRGLQRTYPNLITVEAVKGFENVVSDQYNADGQPFVCSVLPFTRNLFDPRDYTPTCFQELPSVKRRTSNAFELALSVLFQSGIQHFVELPADLASVPPYVKAFLKDVPANWEDICCIDGYPGQYVILARKANGFCYVAGINALKTELRLELRLPFIQKETKAWLITDGETNREFIQQELQLKPDSLIALILAGYGGFIIKLPA